MSWGAIFLQLPFRSAPDPIFMIFKDILIGFGAVDEQRLTETTRRLIRAVTGISIFYPFDPKVLLRPLGFMIRISAKVQRYHDAVNNCPACEDPHTALQLIKLITMCAMS